MDNNKEKYIKLNDIRNISKNKRIVLWGASLFLKELLKSETEVNPNILGVIDKNPDNWGKMCGNYKIYPPEALNELKPEEVILTIINNNEKIYAELKKEFKEKYPNIKLHKNLFTKYNLIKHCVDFYNQKINEVKNKIQSVKNRIRTMKERIIFATNKHIEYKICKYMPEILYPFYLKNWYHRKTGETLNLENPQTFNEKIQWLKLYDSTPIKTRLADKYLVRNWIKEKIGEEYLVPLLGVWEKTEEIDFNKLPNQFVLKCNHGCGYNIIVKDKTKLDIDEAKLKLTTWLKENFAFKNGLELHYKNIKPVIIAEEYIEQIDEQIYDYKFLCFNGQVKYCWIDKDRYTEHKRNIYNLNWEKLDVKINTRYSSFDDIEKPVNFDKMIKFAEILSKDFYFVRVDFYEAGDRLYFSEMTFTSSSGTEKIYPKSFDLELGSYINCF